MYMLIQSGAFLKLLLYSTAKFRCPTLVYSKVYSENHSIIFRSPNTNAPNNPPNAHRAVPT